MSLKNGQLDEFVENTVRETTRLSTNLDNLSDQFNENKQDTNTKFTKIDNKLDDIKSIVSSGFATVEKKELENALKIEALEEVNRSEKDQKMQSMGWKFLLYSAAVSPIVGVILELIIHGLLHK